MKTGKPPCLPVSRDILWHILLALASYRVPRPVTERVVFPDCSGAPSYYVCPRCGITLEREFAAFCDRCGQRLGWRGCREAKIIVGRAARRCLLSNTQEEYSDGCMHRRNRHLVDNSSVCVCYLNKDGGETDYTVGYARLKGLEAINLADGSSPALAVTRKNTL